MSQAFRRTSAFHALALFAVTLALLVRVAVPAGWMPAADGFAITLCTDRGLVAAWVDAEGRLHDEAPIGEPTAAEHLCVFAALGCPLAAVEVAAVVPPFLGVAASLPFASGAVAVGRGLAAPPPPSTGPPATL